MRREAVVSKLRELGFKFRKDGWRVQLWRKGSVYAEVRKCDFLEDVAVTQILRRAGLTAEEVALFLAHCKS